MIVTTNLSKTYTGDPLFEKVSFVLGQNKKIALVGKNGTGKSTLFKIIANITTSDTGTIKTIVEKVGYIPQEWDFKNELVGEYLEKKLDNQWEFYKIEKLLNELQFKNLDQYQEIKTLSEGQKMKLKLLDILLSEPTILLIDEPTNHLDIEGIMWFEKYIKNLKKTVFMISHDREFLNNTVDEVWELDKRRLNKFVGNYDFYKEEKLRLIGKWNDEYARFIKKKAQLEILIKNVRKIKDGKKRGTAVSSAKKRLDREINKNEKEKYVNKKMKNIGFETGITHSKLMVKFDNVSKSYFKKNIFKDLSLNIRGGEKIWLSGPNGAGKSTLIKLIMGKEKPTLGEIYIGNNMRIGYFAQTQVNLDYDKDLLSYFIQETGTYYDTAFGILRRFMFEKEDLKKKVKSLSPGQRARFAFAIFASKNYDMLILDEPDNHLDIETKEILEISLSKYKGTLLIVSHDRFFVERIGIEKILNLKNGLIAEYK